jgi:Flp pilus assembly protein TadD
MRTNDVTGAITDIEQALAIWPDNGHALHMLALARMQIRDYAGAEAAWTEGIAADPANLSGYVNRHRAKLARGDVAGALADVREGLARCPQGSPQRPQLEALTRQLQSRLGSR